MFRCSGCWRVCVLCAVCVGVVGLRALAQGFAETFQTSSFSFSSFDEHPFKIRETSSHGPSGGGFALAEHSLEHKPIRYLMSTCQAAARNCTVHFDLWMQSSSLKTVLWRYCSTCGMEIMPDLVMDEVSNTTTGWVRRSVDIKEVHSVFVLAFEADVSETNSFVALDNIVMEECTIDPQEKVCSDDQYQCPDTSQCIPLDKLCDLQQDCLCGQDEEVRQCELVPEEGRVSFSDCDFQAGDCFWYTTSSPPVKEDSEWRVLHRNSSTKPYLHDPRIAAGAYAYVELPTKARAPYKSQFLRSVNFPSNRASTGECKVRFYYCIVGSSSLYLEQLELADKKPQPLWTSPEVVADTSCSWQRASVGLHNTGSSSYVLQFYALRELGNKYTAVSVTNITLTSACFVKDVFNTCDASGPTGPTQEMCRNAYRPNRTVHVIENGSWQGAQLWTVPLTSTYRLEAAGARGGAGKDPVNTLLRSPAYIKGQVHLREGDQIMVVVGQAGQDSCQAPEARQLPGKCSAHDDYNFPKSGGGGGGATFAYLLEGDEQKLLLMAGGGAGNPYLLYVPSGQKQSHVPTRDYPQEWINVTGRSFSGRTCPWTNNITVAMGGFGGGIGACGEYGGYGGGYAGWPSAQHPTQRKLGSVYVSPSVWLLSNRSDHPDQEEHGYLEVHLVGKGCPCDYLCTWPHAALTDHVQCLCPANLSLANDGFTCKAISHSPDMTTANEDAPVGFAVVMAMSLIPIVALIAFALFVIYTLRYGSVNGRLLHVRICIMQCLRIYSRSLSSEPMTVLPARVIEANPLYDLTAGKITDQKLPEIPRDYLRLSEQLGQGAFGEVYKGFLSGMSGTEREVAVAVKTLPPLCNEQTELDFFMEAYIIRKFNHPNIVRLLGVCFDDHPRYIVLELLAGGNLKSFLQESRPSETKPSDLTINDLVDLAKDIAAGCSYLEKNHFIHRDIAARNCLLTTKGPERVAKLADFGMSRDVYRSDYYRKEGRAFLPIKWMPPEAFTEGIFTTKTDVWSYGVVLWEIFSMGCMPYPDLNNTEVMNFLHIGGRLAAPHGCPQSLYELMLSCWVHRAEERPDFDYILQTLSIISQDTATMLQHPPLMRIPVLCGGKGIKLLNHPAPALREDSPIHCALSDSSLEPLLKSESILITD